MRNSDVQLHLSDAERARRAGDPRAAYGGFVDAGRCAEQYGLWKTALRCYRNAVELDFIDPTAVEHLARIATRAGAGSEWADYLAVVTAPAAPSWPTIVCRDVQLLVGSAGAVASCTRAGTVLAVSMTDDDHVDITPDARFADIPVAMALLVVRRALWPSPRDNAATSFEVRVTYRARHRFKLLEHGDWTRL
jgi:hypothetical protein|nr:hypothetical protein [Kofleriaceae bacterium]